MYQRRMAFNKFSIAPGGEASGYQVTQVDTMLLTHLNPDHAYGLADVDGTPTSPNVRVYVPHQEAEL